MRKIHFILLLLLLVTSLVLVGCGDKTSTTNQPSQTSVSTSTVPGETTPVKTTAPAETPVKGGTFRFITTEGPTGSLGNPEKMMGRTSTQIPPVIEPLIIMDSQGTIRGLLAESLEWSKDYMTVTFHLRKGVKFHNGEDFNADVAIWNLERHVNAKMTTSIASYSKVDDYTIQITQKTFSNSWLTNFRAPLGMMVPPNYVKEKGDAYVDWHPVGTGPFIFKEYVDKDHMTFVRNENYWGQQPNLDAIEFVYIADKTTAQLAFEKGEGDWLDDQATTGKGANDLKAKGFTVTSRPGGMSIVLVPSVTNPDSPLSNIKVREAIEYAIDKESIAENVGQGYYSALYQLAGAAQPVFDPNFQGRKFDVAKAKQLLAEAGYSQGFKTKLICSTHIAGDELPAIQANLKDVGIEVEIELVAITKWMDLETNGWPDGIMEVPMAFTDLYGTNVTRCFVRPTEPNWSKGIYWNSAYRTDELEQACQEYLALPLGPEETAKGKEIVNILYKTITFIPVWDSVRNTITQPWVRDMRKDLPYLAGNINWDWINTWIAPH